MPPLVAPRPESPPEPQVDPATDDQSRALYVPAGALRAFAEDGALVFFEDRRSPPSADMLGHLVVVETDAGELLVRRLLRGARTGAFDLEGVLGPRREDVQLRWGAHITAIIPSHQARRVRRRPRSA
ncbi:MAG TPA: hypothetical protein VIO94_06145 [Phenylobacterium sp.]